LNVLLGGVAEHGQFAHGTVSAEEGKSPTWGDRLLYVQSHTSMSHEKGASHVSGRVGQIEIESDRRTVLTGTVGAAFLIAVQDQGGRFYPCCFQQGGKEGQRAQPLRCHARERALAEGIQIRGIFLTEKGAFQPLP
jgi:hypothetical protein